MKKMLLLMSCLIFLISCEKEGELTKSGSVGIENTAVLKYSGSLSPTSGINASGSTNVFLEGSGAYKLQLKNVAISDGPDLKVYLSKTNFPTDFVNLGNFSGNGTSVYAIPTGVDLSLYSYVLIHCQQHNHLFATAQLIAQ